MIHFIYGPCGSGKTTVLYKYLESDVKQGKKAFFIVPEQETVAVERVIVSSLPASAQLDIEVLNFSRLCNRIFRTYGGLSYNTATKQAKALLMWNTIRELAPMLEEYKTGEPSDFSLTPKMLSAVQELKAYNVSPKKLELACSKMDTDSAAYSKFRDISLIYSAYCSLVSDKFSDSADDISKALEILKEHNIFEGMNVYLDSFAGFTKQELDFIVRISELCDELYITLPIKTPRDKSIHLESLRQTVSKLKKSISSAKYDEVFLDEIQRTDSMAIKHLQNNVWNFEAEPFNDEIGEDISLYLCDTPYSEADTVATLICKEIENGARYNDIAIILRDSEKYRGILDVSLDKYEIPFFMSEKTDLMSKALSKFIFSALKVKESNFKGSNLIAHLKSGFCDIDPFDIDIFEDYVTTWNINGNKFFEEKWTMNPDGYSANMTHRGERILSIANSVKDKVISALSLYFTRLDASSSVKEMCQATLEFLKSSSITEKVRQSCASHLAEGNKKAADEDMKLYSLTLNILYDLSSTVGDCSLKIEEFAAALNLMFSESDIGTIPTSADEVTIGSASMLRTGNVKTAIIMGLNEGEFPASVKDNGIFTDSDKELLEGLDIELSSNANVKTSEELFYLYRALATPQSKLIITHSSLRADGQEQRNSIAIERIHALFPTMHEIKEDKLSYVDKIWNIESAKALYPQIKNADGSKFIKDILATDNQRFIKSLEIPVSQKECSIDKDIATKLFGSRLSLTQSRLEKYVLCGFDYYCTYVLQLRETKKAAFQLNDIGTFIHYILEMFMKEITSSNTLNLTLSDDEIDEILKKTVRKYLSELLGEDYALSNRTKHLFIRLNKLSFMIVKNLINEFKASDFYPAHFELKVGMGEGSIDALEFNLADGSILTLRGIADRVDTYKKDDKVYIRIVDYKTGSKEFSLEELKNGLNTQLLIYLFSICKLKNPKQRAMFGADESTEILPGGIQYLSSNAPVVSVDKFCDGDEIEKLIQNEFSRSGLLNDDPDVLYAINHDLDTNIITHTKKKKDGTIYGKGLASEESFDEIYDLLSETIVSVAESLKDGKADAIPLREGDNSPCRYCRMKSICRASTFKNTGKGGK